MISYNYIIYFLFLCLFIIIFLSLFYYFFNFKEYFNNINNNNKIPLNIFQTWNNNNLPNYINKSVYLIKKNNPEFKHHIYNDYDCYNFIKNNFPNDVLNAYNKLKPGAYKADLWRYCILYKYGGIYLDIKYRPFNNFKFINLIDNEYFVRDRDNGIYNALLIVKKNNKIMHDCIYKVVDNVNKNYYGNNPLLPTGPLMMKSFFNEYDIQNFNMYLDFVNSRIMYNNNCILYYNDKLYRKEQSLNQTNKHYDTLWNERNIYNF